MKDIVNLDQGFANKNLRTVLKRILEGGEIQDTKEDLMALTAIFIEEAWESVAEWIKQTNGALPSDEIYSESITSQDWPRLTLLGNAFLMLGGRLLLISEIERRTNQFLQNRFRAWAGQRNLVDLQEYDQPAIPAAERQKRRSRAF